MRRVGAVAPRTLSDTSLFFSGNRGFASSSANTRPIVLSSSNEALLLATRLTVGGPLVELFVWSQAQLRSWRAQSALSKQAPVRACS
jgi:hypothetical protein